MDRDPSVYIILNLDTNLEVTYSTTHFFGSTGLIERSLVRHGDHYRVPLDELDAAMEWGAHQLNEYFENGSALTFGK